MADEKHKAPLTPLTVMFADITGSTTLYAQRGDATAFALASTCLDQLETEITASGGRVIKRLGDGVLAVFDLPLRAVEAAVRIRNALADPNANMAREGVRVRVGIASGPAVLADDDVYGDTVNVASRLMNLAGVDEIFLSGKAYEALPPALRAQMRVIDQLLLRNRPAPVLVYELARQEEDATVSVGVRMRASASTMEITHGEHLFVVGPERPKVTIGRHANSDIRVEHEMVSRTHAEVTLRGDKFVLVDRSTNGTYVYIDRGPMLRVVREELVLSGGGRIVPGVETDEPILYRVSAA
jgi:class 3 adenylate cyclase